MTRSTREEDRVERQVRFFGVEGQARIGLSRAAIVGCGGLGSHIAQQLAFVGVGDVLLIDPDTADASSGNRMIGMEPDHAHRSSPKVEIVAEMVSRIRPEARVERYCGSVGDRPAIRALGDRSIVFCCVDRVTARSDTNVICSAFDLPLIDSATEIILEGGVWGGRVTLCLEGDQCLSCMGEISQQDLRRELLDEQGQQEEEEMYGLPHALLGDSGPSTVFLNGIIASHAVHEWAVHVSGVRPAQRNLVFDGPNGVVRVDRTKPHADCYVCGRIRGSGDLSSATLFGQ